MTDEKAPSLKVKGTNIKPNTLGEVAWGMMQEYCDHVGAAALDVSTGDNPQVTKAAFGTVIEGMFILGSAKLNFGLIDMLGLIERVKFNLIRQVEAQQNRALYKKATDDIRLKGKVAKDVIESP